jgi:translation initiation factor 4A
MSEKYPQRNNKNYRYNNGNQGPNPNQNQNQNHNQSGKFNVPSGADASGGSGGSGDGSVYRSNHTGYNNNSRYRNDSSLPNESRFEGRPNGRMNRGNKVNFNYQNDRNGNDRNGNDRNGNDRNGNDRNGGGLNINRNYNNSGVPPPPSERSEHASEPVSVAVPLPLPASVDTTQNSVVVNTPLEVDTSTPPKEFDKWEDLEGILNEDIMRGVYSYGFDSPSLIQRKALLTMFDRRDIIAQAQSGTGKTGVFTIGVLQNINPELNKTQGLIMAPTRELAKQIHEVISSIGSVNKSIKYHLLIGGTSTDDDAFELKNNTPHIIVGCPGRVYDMMRRNNIIAKDISILVLDEADEMLSIGFKEQVYNIFQYLSNDVQVGLFSATLPPELQALTDKFMRNPVRILVKSELLTLEGIKQYYVALNDDSQKYATLKDIFNIISMSQCIIYCNSIKRVMDLTEAMQNDGFPVCCIHSNMEKLKRDEAYSEFKAGKHRVLISSDVTSRGIDVQQVRTVLNFDLPKCVFKYLHRIGRSGRWGRKGTAINFVTRWDMKTMKEIERHYHTIVDELPSNIAID